MFFYGSLTVSMPVLGAELSPGRCHIFNANMLLHLEHVDCEFLRVPPEYIEDSQATNWVRALFVV